MNELRIRVNNVMAEVQILSPKMIQSMNLPDISVSIFTGTRIKCLNMVKSSE